MFVSSLEILNREQVKNINIKFYRKKLDEAVKKGEKNDIKKMERILETIVKK